MSKIKRRKIVRDGYCRGCDSELKVGTDIVSTKGWRTGLILFCIPCALEIGRLAKQEGFND